METRPRIKPVFGPADKVVEILVWAILIAMWAVVLFNYPELPGTIPVHYNAAGNIDGYGDKATIFITPGIATVFAAGLTFLNRFPYMFNYARKITAENAYSQYSAATRLIRYLKLATTITFLVTTITTIKAAYAGSTAAGTWLLPCLTGIIALPLLYFGGKLVGNRRTSA